jgi:hypothetical protein
MRHSARTHTTQACPGSDAFHTSLHACRSTAQRKPVRHKLRQCTTIPFRPGARSRRALCAKGETVANSPRTAHLSLDHEGLIGFGTPFPFHIEPEPTGASSTSARCSPMFSAHLNPARTLSSVLCCPLRAGSWRSRCAACAPYSPCTCALAAAGGGGCASSRH